MNQVPPLNPYEGPAYDPSLRPTFDANDLQFRAAAAEQVNAPSIALMVLAGASGLLQLLGLAANMLSIGLGLFAVDGPSPGPIEMLFMGGIGIVSGAIGLVVSGIVLYGAMKMRRLENYSLSMVSSILMIVPCTSPCCLLGIPIGIWAVVVLNRPEVKGAFQS